MDFEIEGQKQKASNSWYRGESCNFNPNAENLESADAVLRHVVGSWAPPEPLIGPTTAVCAFGSCFAEHISAWLAESNFNVLTKQSGEAETTYVVRFGEGLVNSYALLQQFEWAFENKVNEAPLWHGYTTEQFGYDEKIRQRTRDMFDRSDVFILTLGLSEVWYDEKTGGVFWRAVPQKHFDPSRHKFRVSTVEENKQNLRRIYQLIRQYRPSAKIIFTMSPIPLVATFRPVTCITANSASKAILRAALDELIREVVAEGHAYYWPSYEIVLDVFNDRWHDDRRHVRRQILDYVMTVFERAWCKDIKPRYTMAQAWIAAKSADGSYPQGLPKFLEKGQVEGVRRVLEGLENREEKEKIAAIMTRIDELSASMPRLLQLKTPA